MFLHGLSAQTYDLEEKPISSGGEGSVYGVKNNGAVVVKVYNSDAIRGELEEKLRIMVRRPPGSSVETQVAWPRDVLYDQGGAFVGFAMPRLNIGEELTELYKYPPGRYNASTLQKIVVAQNICAVISEVHRAGYVFGDFNPGNIGVDVRTGHVAFLDTDSYHIRDDMSGKTYRCKVCLPGYAAPEVLKACGDRDFADAPLPTFTKESDNFALAIHIFRLLMNGFNPFNGINDDERVSQASLALGNEAIKRDAYCFKLGKKPLSVAVPPLRAMPEEIGALFNRAFIDGRRDPKKRPDAAEWHRALENYKNALKTCDRNARHQYAKRLSSCPWCEADERYANATTPRLKQQSLSAPLAPGGAPQTRPIPPRGAPNAFAPPGGKAPRPVMTPRQRILFAMDIVNAFVRNAIYGCFVGAAFMVFVSAVYGIWLRGARFDDLPAFFERVYYWHVAFPPRTTGGTFHVLLVLSAVVPILLSTAPPVIGRIRANSGGGVLVLGQGAESGIAFFAAIFGALLPGAIVGTICLYVGGFALEVARDIRILTWPPQGKAPLVVFVPIAFFVWRAIGEQLRNPMSVAEAMHSLRRSLCAALCAILGLSAGFVAAYAELAGLDAYDRDEYTVTCAAVNAIFVTLVSNRNDLSCKAKIVIAILVSAIAAFVLNRVVAALR
jgi:serine/threonine protein kinase